VADLEDDEGWDEPYGQSPEVWSGADFESETANAPPGLEFDELQADIPTLEPIPMERGTAVGSVNIPSYGPEDDPPGDDPSLEELPESFVFDLGSTNSIGTQIYSHIDQYGHGYPPGLPLGETPFGPGDPRESWFDDDGWQIGDGEISDMTATIYLSQDSTLEGRLEDDGSYSRHTSTIKFDDDGFSDYTYLLDQNGHFGPEQVPDYFRGPYGIETLINGESGPFMDPLTAMSEEEANQAWDLYSMGWLEAQMEGLSGDPLQRVWDYKRQNDMAKFYWDGVNGGAFSTPSDRQRYVNLAQGDAAAAKASNLAALWAGEHENSVVDKSTGNLATQAVYDENGVQTGTEYTPLARSMIQMWSGIGTNVHGRSPGYYDDVSNTWQLSTSEAAAERAARKSGNTDNVAWSAAMISSVMDDPMFEGAEGHHTYMGYARLRRARGLRAGEYGAFRPTELDSFRVGDVVCSNRSGLRVATYDTFDRVGVGAGNHCDIVSGFEVNENTGEREVIMIGGNLSGRVQRRTSSGSNRWRDPDPNSVHYENFLVIRKADEDMPALPIPGTPDSTHPEYGNLSQIANADDLIEGTGADHGIFTKGRELGQHEVAYLYYMASVGYQADFIDRMANAMRTGHTLYNSDGSIYAGQANNPGWDPGDHLYIGAPARPRPEPEGDTGGAGSIEESLNKKRKLIKIKIKKTIK